MLVPGVRRDREQASGLPLEGLRLLPVVPDPAGPVAGQDIDGLFVKMPLRFRLAARHDLDQVRIVFQYVIWNIDDRAASSLAEPRSELDLAQILESEIP